MKTLIRTLAIALFGATTLTATEKGKLGLVGGVTHLSGINEPYSHNTHREDFFLPRAGVPGSAGETEVTNLTFAQIGVAYKLEMFRNWAVSLEVGGLFGTGRDDHQNDNDPRPPSIGAFVYSDAKYGAYLSAGISYKFDSVPGLYLGARANLNCVFVQHGWDRWGSDEADERDTLFLPTLGPVIGYQFTENTSVELRGQFGTANGASLMFSYGF